MATIYVRLSLFHHFDTSACPLRGAEYDNGNGVTAQEDHLTERR